MKPVNYRDPESSDPHTSAMLGGTDRASTGVERGAVDRVFLTGGSSLVPSVRRIFEERFGVEKLAGGGELTSVVSGLAWSGLAAG